MRAFVLFISVLVSTIAFADVIQAPIYSFDYQQNPSEMEWKHIETEHFDLIFPEEVAHVAPRVAHLLESAYPYVSRGLEVEPKKISLILQNQTTNSNGFVTLAPRRSEWFVTPSTDPVLSNTEWLKTLSIHEFRHVAQFQKTRRGFNLFFEIVLGQIGQALGLALTLPPWYLEGDAVGTETALTKGGRGRLPQFDRDLRTLLLSGKKWNYDKAHIGSYEDYIPNHYVYGYFYTSWLKNQYGDFFLSKVANLSAESSYNPLSYYNAQAAITGVKFEKYYENVMSDLIKEWKERADKITPTPATVKSGAGRWGWTNYYYPQGATDGKILALKRGLSFIDQFVLLDGKKEEVLFYPGILENQYPFKLRGGRFAFFELEVDPRWGNRDFSRLRVYDLQRRKFVLSKRKMKGRLAVPDHAGNKIVYIDWKTNQDQAIVVLDSKGEELKRLPYPIDKVITSIDWLNNDEVVFVVKDFDDNKTIVKMDLNSKTETVLLDKGTTNIGYLTVENGDIFFEDPTSGIDNISVLTSAGPKQITRAKFGAYAPDIDDNKLIYNDYSVDGMNVVVKDMTWNEEQKSEDSFYPIYEKFAKEEKFSDLQSAYLKNQSYDIKDYSQFKHSVNLHSWAIVVPPLSPIVSVVGLSRDVLNKFTFSAGASYNLNEGTPQAFTSAAWTYLYPVFDINAAYGNRRQEIEGRTDKWEEGTFEAGISVPWQLIQGRFTHTFTARAFSKLIKVTNKLSFDETEVSDGALFSPGGQISYSFTQRLARRDMNPHWGFTFNGVTEEGKDITGNGMRGRIHSLDSRYYLPGLWYHHSFWHQFAYEKQRDRAYQYASFIFYPRGTKYVFLEEFTKYSGNYLMPLFYPDYNLSRYLYFKRISLNLFYDELNGTDKGTSYRAASTGWEGIFEMAFLRLMYPISIGVRGSYVLAGEEKVSNYEVFLASTLATY